MRFEANKSNMRNTWSTINEILCKSKHKQFGIKAILSEGKQIDDPHRIAELFNRFYLDIGPSLVNKSVQPTNSNFRKYLTRNTLYMSCILSETEIVFYAHCNFYFTCTVRNISLIDLWWLVVS